jgi:GAF domain-containing protein
LPHNSVNQPPNGADTLYLASRAREAALREILVIIRESRADETPVFDAILRNAAQLCDAPMAGLNIINESRSQLIMVAHCGTPLKHFVVGETSWAMDSDLVPAQTTREARVIQVEDLAETEPYRQGEPVRVASVEQEGIRTFLAVPLVSGEEAIGCIALYRRKVKPFSDDEIELVEAFAEQAVIAIENVRQFREI